jgi:hypothetical protein
MTDLREAAQQALNSLRGYRREIGCEQPCDAERELEAALEQPCSYRCEAWPECGCAALEQPEQEPVAWMDPNRGEVCSAHWLESHAPERDVDRFSCPLYTNPPRREALEQPEQEVKGCDHCNHPLYAAIKCHACGRVTEQEQEPVAWCDIEEDGTIHGLRYWSEPGRREHAFYTHPPRREWRGLTEEEIIKLARGVLEKPANDSEPAAWQLADGIARAIEAALKERNA